MYFIFKTFLFFAGNFSSVSAGPCSRPPGEYLCSPSFRSAIVCEESAEVNLLNCTLSEFNLSQTFPPFWDINTHHSIYGEMAELCHNHDLCKEKFRCYFQGNAFCSRF